MGALLRALLLAIALVSTSGLVVGGVRAAPPRMMALPSVADAQSLSTEEIQAELVTAQKVSPARPRDNNGGRSHRRASRARTCRDD